MSERAAATGGSSAGRSSGAGIGFLASAFLIVGLTGLFASIAAPVPLQRALLRDAALDEALALAGASGAGGSGQAATLDAGLRERLGDSAAALDGDRRGLAARVQAERAAMRARFVLEADTIAARLHWLVVIVTLAGAGFGAALFGSLARQR